VLPLLGTILLSAAGQVGFKLAVDLGKKLFGKPAPESNPETFSAQLKKQVDLTSAAPAAASTPAVLQTPVAQAPRGLQTLASSVVADVPMTAATSAYRRFDKPWPGRSVELGLISSQHAP
jgi:hypothetical protein